MLEENKSDYLCNQGMKVFLSVPPKPDAVQKTTGRCTTKKNKTQNFYTLIITIAKIKMQVTHLEKIATYVIKN